MFFGKRGNVVWNRHVFVTFQKIGACFGECMKHLYYFLRFTIVLMIFSRSTLKLEK